MPFVLPIRSVNAAPEVERTYARAQELCEQIGDTLQVFPPGLAAQPGGMQVGAGGVASL